jgi:hypothetical protein
MKTFFIGLAMICMALAQSKTPVVYKSSDFSTSMGMEPQAVPVVRTIIFQGTSRLQPGSWVSCGSTGRVITLLDGNGIMLLNGVSIASNSVMSLSPFAGAVFPKSMSIVASASGCFYHINVGQ